MFKSISRILQVILFLAEILTLLFPKHLCANDINVFDNKKHIHNKSNITADTKILTSRDIAKKVLKSLVLVVTQGDDGVEIAKGSGFVVDNNVIATNLHIFKRATKGYVKFVETGEVYLIESIKGLDMDHDVCLLQFPYLNAPILPSEKDNLLEVGDEIYVGGNPKGLEGSISKGIVSAIRQEQGLIQIDASISPGSSGGPVVNRKAYVIGIATSMLPGGQNLNFAVPISYTDNLFFYGDIPVRFAGALSLNDVEDMRLNGPVRNILSTKKEWDYSNISGNLIGDQPEEIMTGYEAFNDKGNIVESRIYVEGKELFRGYISYNRHGFPEKQILVDASEKEVVNENFDETKSINFLLSKRSFGESLGFGHKEDKTKLSWERKYDSYGNVESEGGYINGVLYKTSYQYRRNGVKSLAIKLENNKVIAKCKYKYEFDERKNWTQEIESCDYGAYTKVNENNRIINYYE